MPFRFALVLLLFWLASGSVASIGSAQAPSLASAAGDEGAEWKLESIRTNDGKTYYGYVATTGPREIEFVQVVRPPGRDMHLVVRPFAHSAIAAIDYLPEAERKRLALRIEQRKQRMAFEAGARESVELTEAVEGDHPGWSYQGPWFSLLSTGDEETTRRAVVSIEQIFRAYRHALPPRTQPQERLRVVLYGSMDQYRWYLHQQGVEIEHPAFYSAATNAIVAGADLTQYAARLKQIRAANDRLRERYEALHRAFPASKRDLSARLRQSGFTTEEIREELRARDKAWEGEYKAMMDKLDEADRRNESRYAEVARQFYARLRHEAFHAYVENFLFPQREFAFPRWLNEGLAQIFESARLDGDTLRIDAPDGDLLRRLQGELTQGAPMPLARLLAAEEESFVAAHGRAGISERSYLYSWGVAWHLLARGDLGRSEALQAYVSAGAERLPAADRFERLIGKQLPEYEREWREAILAYGPASR